jgi:hypothetical protein
MKAIGTININSIRTQELERKTDSLSIGIISPPTGAGGEASLPLSAGPDLTVKAWVRLAFIIITNLM